MKAHSSIIAALCLLVGMGVAARGADRFKNLSFEEEATKDGDTVHWGDNGELFGGASIVAAGTEDQPAAAGPGKKCLRIDVPASSWNGVWQQVAGGPNKAFTWKAKYQIKGTLPDSVATFLKAEFYDESGEQISAVEGEWFRNDTGGKWLECTLKGTTPAATKEVRFVIIAGDNSESAEVKNHIYWDDASAQ